jgi:diaminopimelate epimerase
MTLPLRFVKMCGGGNDFLIFLADGRALSEDDRRRLSLICRRGLSVGADGALFLTPVGGDRVRLDYYNADGGLASFCANGTRCAARFAADRALTGKSLVLETGWGPVQADVAGGLVTLTLPPVLPPRAPMTVSVDGVEMPGIPMEVGVPHWILFVGDELESLDLARLGPPLRRHPAMPHGANVNFVRVDSPSRLSIRTFERGVEAETLACGSGVVASAVTATAAGKTASPVACATKSGVVFQVEISDAPGGMRAARLTGDAREIYAADLTEEAWQE